MDGLDYNESNNTYCLNVSDILNQITELQGLMIFNTISILLLLVPTLILQLFFICRYKSTFLHRQFLYTTVVIILLNATYIAYSSTVDGGCPSFFLFVYRFNWYLLYVQMMQMTTIHLLLLYKLCKLCVHPNRAHINRLSCLINREYKLLLFMFLFSLLSYSTFCNTNSYYCIFWCVYCHESTKSAKKILYKGPSSCN